MLIDQFIKAEKLTITSIPSGVWNTSHGNYVK